MKVAVTGANGQIGQDLVRLLSPIHEVYGLGRNHLDIRDGDQCKKVMKDIDPDVIIHSAAYTSVDLAETEEDEAYLVNAFGSRNVAIAAEAVGARICYISTDYVFDGTGNVPYREYDNTNPQSVYGKSKRAGEQFVQSFSSKYYIVRTSWVYGKHGQNFVKTMLMLGSERNHLKVVDDQIGSPTYTVDLSRFIAELICTEKYGIYHASNTGQCSWYEFAMSIFKECGIPVNIEPCATEDFRLPAPRPKFSALEHMSIRANGLQDLRHWLPALQDFLLDLKSSESICIQGPLN